ncbi:MAG: hypothetical protein DRI48_02265 [Chloroflexi bacterium]|nr:MAG: hypothetical protein DRI48_02265 [Chloroflexota bacterium]
MESTLRLFKAAVFDHVTGVLTRAQAFQIAPAKASTSPHLRGLEMTRKEILLLHGFISSRRSTKARYLEERFETVPEVTFHAVDFNPTPRDFTHTTITGRIERLRQYVLDHRIAEMSLIGSSLGGLVALHYAHRFGGVERMLLLAPALSWQSVRSSAQELAQWKEAGAISIFHPAFEQEIPLRYDLQSDGSRYRDPVPPPTLVVIVHGRDDETVPVDHSRAYAATYPAAVHLVEVEAGHDLNEHLDVVWEYLQSFLLERVLNNCSSTRPWVRKSARGRASEQFFKSL